MFLVMPLVIWARWVFGVHVTAAACVGSNSASTAQFPVFADITFAFKQVTILEAAVEG
jgi:hypothetical protein